MAAALAVACAPELSRSEAAELLRDAKSFLREPTRQLTIAPGRAEQAVRLGFWGAGDGCQLAPELRDEVAAVSSASRVTLRRAFSTTFEITGIAGAAGADGGVKRIEYSWRYADLPLLGEFLAHDGGSGTAEAQLHDDGWRLTGFDPSW